jgi:hypothetical protein
MEDGTKSDDVNSEVASVVVGGEVVALLILQQD